MTPAELDILQYMADGLTDKEMAEIMHVSIHTVYSRVHQIYEKFCLFDPGKGRGGAYRAKAVADGFRLGLLK